MRVMLEDNDVRVGMAQARALTAAATEGPEAEQAEALSQRVAMRNRPVAFREFWMDLEKFEKRCHDLSRIPSGFTSHAHERRPPLPDGSSPVKPVAPR